MTRNIAFFLGLVLWAFMGSGCIEFRTLSLYDGTATEPPAPKPESVDQFVSPLLFADDTLNVWGIVADSCKTFALTDVAYKGDRALELNWNRAGCEWVGFGMGWDNYAGKNIEPLLPYAAFEMYVRTKEDGKRIFGLPIVLTLEDYSKQMSFAYTGNRYFERYYIDENWQRVQVPLSAFDDEGKGIDYTNIKQLQMEMQSSAEVIIDEIRLVMYEPPVEESWVDAPAAIQSTSLPQPLFTDAAVNDNGWGFISSTYGCQQVMVTDEEVYDGEKAIKASWSITEAEACSLMVFGISWSKWDPVDVQEMKEQATLRFVLKAENPENLDFRIELEDFNRASAGVDWNTSYATPVKDGWWAVSIPMKELVAGLDETQIKTLQFRLQGTGEMYLDDIRWE